MQIESVFFGVVLILAIAFVYQYGKRLMAETKLYELEQDIKAVQNTIKTAYDTGRVINHEIKSKEVSFILSEYIKAKIQGNLKKEPRNYNC